jgi:hypothetical protein
LTATSADGHGAKGWFVAVVGLAGDLGGVTEGVAKKVDGVALEAHPDVGVDGGGDADVGVSEEFLDHDEFRSLIQEEGRRRVAEVVEADAAEPGPVEQGGEVPGEGGPFDRGTVGPGEHVAAVLPVFACRFAFLVLPVAVLFEGAQARRRQGDASFGTLGLGREGDQAAGVGALEGAADAGSSAGQVEVFPAQAEEFALSEPGMQSEVEEDIEDIVFELDALLGGSLRIEARVCVGRSAADWPGRRRRFIDQKLKWFSSRV